MNSISLRGVTGRDEPIRQRFEENDQISDFLIRENRGGTAPSKRRIDIDICPCTGAGDRQISVPFRSRSADTIFLDLNRAARRTQRPPSAYELRHYGKTSCAQRRYAT